MSQSVAEFLAAGHPTAFSFEILPPVRGKSIESTYRNIERLLDFNPAYINITTHRNEVSYRPAPDGGFVEVSNRRRPGTVAVAAALRERYNVRTVPHLICGNFSRNEIEDQLIDLSYLGITDLLVLRGDRPKNSRIFTTHADGHSHAAQLADQVMRFNLGVMADGSESDPPTTPFTFGVAGYPEKHEEAMNLNVDLDRLKAKVDAGASYIVTQMVFDNAKFFSFVEACRSRGITVPIIPGLKPLTSLRQLSMLPRIFHIDIPDDLARELNRCTDDAHVKQVGVEWAVSQATELKERGVPSIHFYAMSAVESVATIARRVY